jgi:hypothetical protein
LNSRGYFESAQPWMFAKIPIMFRRFMKIEGDDFIPIDILVAKTNRIDAIVESALEQEWSGGKVSVVSKSDLIWLKSKRGSEQDKVDIRKLKNDEA